MVHRPDGQRPASGEQFQGPIGRITKEALRLVKATRFRLLELNRALDDAGIPPPFVDQYPGKRVPFTYSRLYGPIGQVTLTSVNPTTYTLPRKGNIVVSSTQRFHWCRVGAFFFTASGASASDLLNPVAQSGGGHSTVSLGFEHGIDFDVLMYDRTRSRLLQDSAVPISTMAGGTVVNKAVPRMTVFEPGSEIEPRLFVRRQTSTTPVYVNLAMFGFIEELQ